MRRISKYLKAVCMIVSVREMYLTILGYRDTSIIPPGPTFS